MSLHTGEIQPVIRDPWLQPELNRKDVQVIPPVGKVNGASAGKVGDQKTENNEQPPSSDQREKRDSQIARQVQTYLDETSNLQLNFKVEEDSGKTVVQMVDKETGKLIRQIPPESLVQMRAKLEELRGILFDNKV